MSAFTEPTFAWEPITPRGVAAFARASLERLFIVQCIFAALAAAVVVWFLADGVFPTIDQAIGALPATGEIRAGELVWPVESPVLLAEGNRLALSVDLNHGGALRSPADFQLEFGRRSLRVFSLFGTGEWDYPPAVGLAANQLELRPLWGAWSPDLLALAGIGTFLGLLLVWPLLATLYFLPVWLISFFTDRDLNFRASWKLAAAALLPGALLMSVSLVLYELNWFDLVQFSFAAGIHLVTGWIYLFISPMFLKRGLPVAPGNPFRQH